MKKRWLAGLMTHQYEKLPVDDDASTTENVTIIVLQVRQILQRTRFIAMFNLKCEIVRIRGIPFTC